MSSAINWFEIPAVDFGRAVAFYEAVLGQPIHVEEFFGVQNGIMRYEDPGVGGAIVRNPQHEPSAGGALVYLNARGELDAVLARVAPAGGTVLMPATSIGPMGTIAVILDTEGNRVGLHQEA